MTEEVDTDDVSTENTTAAQATSQDQQSKNNAQIEAWVDDPIRRNYETFMDVIINAVEETFSDALKMEMTDLTDEQPVESDLYRILHAKVADDLDDARIVKDFYKMESAYICKD